MKKTPSSAPKQVAPPMSDLAKQTLSRWAFFLALIAPLADTLLIFPLRQAILANSSGTGPVYQVVYQLTELLILTAFFLLLGLAIYCAVSDETRTLGRIVAYHGIASVFIVILLRLAILYLMAWLDQTLYLPFDLSNQTLNTLTKNEGAETMALLLTLFLNQVILFAVLAAAAILSLHSRQKALRAKADLSPAALHEHFDASPLPSLMKIVLAIFASVGFLNRIVDTVITVVTLGAPDTFSTLLDLVVPYFLLAIYCLLGYLALEYGTRYIAKRSTL